ncbi:MAG: hypothetical protein OHK0028_24790 [Deltaproteobacteria bacterium]
MGFMALTEAEIAPGKPVSNDLLKKVKDNFDDHEARISAGGGAGIGSIGEVLNGSFESDSDADGVPDNWTRYLYPGGSAAFDPVDSIHGKRSYKFVHPGGVGNGGGYLESDYIAVSNLFFPPLPMAFKASVTGIKIQVVCRYFAADASGDPGSYLGERTLWTHTAGSAGRWYLAELTSIPLPYVSARYVKFRFIGGHYDTNVAGAVWFDAVGVKQYPVVIPLADAINQPPVTWSPWSGWTWVGATHTITIPSGANFRWLAIQVDLQAGYYTWMDESGSHYSPRAGSVRAHIDTNQVISSVFTNADDYTAYEKGYVYADISGLAPGTHSLRFQGLQDTQGGLSQNAIFRSQNLYHYFTSGKWNVNAYTGQITEVYL